MPNRHFNPILATGSGYYEYIISKIKEVFFIQALWVVAYNFPINIGKRLRWPFQTTFS